jgi:hypothetical protein
MKPDNHIRENKVRVKFVDLHGNIESVHWFDLANDTDRRDMGRACAHWQQYAVGNRIESEVMTIVRR